MYDSKFLSFLFGFQRKNPPKNVLELNFWDIKSVPISEFCIYRCSVFKGLLYLWPEIKTGFCLDFGYNLYFGYLDFRHLLYSNIFCNDFRSHLSKWWKIDDSAKNLWRWRCGTTKSWSQMSHQSQINYQNKSTTKVKLSTKIIRTTFFKWTTKLK